LSILDISSKRLKALSDNLIGAGLETETTQTQFSEMQIADVIDEIVAQHKPTAKDKGVTLSAEVAPSARAMMRIDASVIHGVLDKLVDNAVKFTPKGHVHIEARLEEDSWLHIIVEDTGVGIPNEKLSQIFEAFEQVDDHDTRNFDGAGLGLATAKNLAGLLGGRVRVNSTLGQGSRFKIKIPVQVVAGAAPFENGQHVVADGVKTPVLMGTAEEVGIKKSKAPEQMRLLVAEDNRANRMLIKTMLKSVGHTIDFAEDGVQAVERYTKNRPDFVLMDLSMPNKNGFDATREIRELERKDSLRRCPIVAVTANVTEDDRRKCFDAGMDAFLPKPVKKAKLLETITEVSA
jgi:CheY-like chemotaxis protein/two-component sensor histidine kinase